MQKLLVDWGLWALFLGVVIYLDQLRRGRGPALWYLTISDEPLLTLRPDLLGSLELTSRGRRVERAHVVAFALVNAGGKPIRPEDFVRGIEIQVQPGGRLLDAVHVAGYLDAIDAPFDFDERTLRIQPVLLNPGECIAIRLLLDSFERPLSLSFRIADVPRIPESISHPTLWWNSVGKIVIAGFVSLVLGIVCTASRRMGGWWPVVSVLSGIGSFIAGALFAINWLMDLWPRHPRFSRVGRHFKDAKFHDLFKCVASLPAGMGDPEHAHDFQVVSAHYGTPQQAVDVTSILQRMVSGGRLMVTASNDLANDPAPGVVKTLRVTYTIGGVRRTSSVRETEALNIP